MTEPLRKQFRLADFKRGEFCIYRGPPVRRDPNKSGSDVILNAGEKLKVDRIVPLDQTVCVVGEGNKRFVLSYTALEPQPQPKEI